MNPYLLLSSSSLLDQICSRQPYHVLLLLFVLLQRNILLKDDMTPKVTDFGLSRIATGDEEQDQTNTDVGACFEMIWILSVVYVLLSCTLLSPTDVIVLLFSCC